MVALAALAGGCARVIVTDLVQEKLDIVGRYKGVATINGKTHNLAEEVAKLTDKWGADVAFEASGSAKAYDGIFDLVRPGGCLVLVGMPIDPVPFDVVAACVKEARIETIFRYANVHARAIELIASGKVDLNPLISGAFPFEQSIEAVERAASGRPTDVKLQIKMPPAPAEG
jgi:D-xylulose reductase